ncbi:hypothetical protein [Nitrosomonas mobilis]|nr:hypothetical protein [Nitrosomonas mobilis]
MTNSNIFKLNKPEQNDLLQEILREGAREKGAIPYIILSRQFPRCVM